MEAATSPRRTGSLTFQSPSKRRMEGFKRRFSSPLLRLERQKDKSKIFGVALSDLSRSARVPCGEHGESIPGVVFSILEALQSDPSTYTETGIFRTAGPASRVEQLVQILDDGKELNLKKETRDTLADLLKMYFRNLPEPLFTFELYDRWAAVVDAPNLEPLRQCIYSLPAENREIAKHLFFFFVELTKSSEKTRMDPMNIGIVWGPNLLWRTVLGSSGREIATFSAEVVALVITHYFQIFSWPFIGQCIIKTTFTSSGNDAITLKEGDVVNVIKSSHRNGEWVGLFNDQVVFFPSNIAQEIQAHVLLDKKNEGEQKVEVGKGVEEKKGEEGKKVDGKRGEERKAGAKRTENGDRRPENRAAEMSSRKVKRSKGPKLKQQAERKKKVEQLEKELETLRDNIRDLEQQIAGTEVALTQQQSNMWGNECENSC